MSTLIEIHTEVRAPAALLFDLELDVDIHAASLSKSNEAASTSTGSRQLDLGDEVTFTARHFGLPWRMTSRVTAFDRPKSFVDEQVRGPVRALHHEHVFTPVDGQELTVMIDRMTVTAPFGIIGTLVTRLVLAPYLKRLLQQRAQHIKSVAEVSAS